MIAKQELFHYESGEPLRMESYKNYSDQLHWHNDYQLCVMEKGSGTLYAAGERYTLDEGAACLLPPQLSHCFRCEKNDILTIITFPQETGEEIMDGFKVKSTVLQSRYDFSTLLNFLRKELSQKTVYYRKTTKNALTQLLVEIFRNEVLEKNTSTDFSLNDFDGLLREIDEKYAYYSFQDATAFMGLNKTYFSAMFHKYCGMTFSQYLNRVRVEKAVELLRKDNAKVTFIAMKCGFDTVRNFNRVFKSVTGYTPKQLPADYSFTPYNVRAAKEEFCPVDKTAILLK